VSATRTRRSRPLVGAALALVAASIASAMAACGGPRAAVPKTPDASPMPTPRAPDRHPAGLARLDAPPGGLVVIPLESPQAPRPPTAALDDGRPVPISVHRIGVRVLAPVAGEVAPDGWLPAPGVWQASPLDPADASLRAGRGAWAYVLDLPADGAGQGLLLDGVRLPVNWLPAASALVTPAAGAAEDPWAPAAGPDAGDAVLLMRAEPERASPLTRWRHRLLIDGLRPGAPFEPFADPVIEAIARQNEDRWRVALAWLWAADADAAIRLRKRLAGVVDFGGVSAPAWPADHAALDRLLSELLDPALRPGERAAAADRWLAALPPAVAWVIDEGGTVDEGRDAPLIAVGLANLMDRATLAWAAVAASPSATPDLRPLPSRSAMTVLVVPPPNATGTTTLDLHAGRWTVSLPAATGRVAASPPGLALGPFLPDWTMPAWLRSQAEPARAEWATAALLHRPAPAPGDAPTPPRSRRWELLVECRLVPGVGSATREGVRVYVGPASAPIAVVHIDGAGDVVRERPPGDVVREEFQRDGLAPATERIAVTRGVDRWSFRVPLPPDAVERNGLLRLGITRTDALGRRQAWPRPMLPWQGEPGRAAIDTDAWTELGGDRDDAIDGASDRR